MSKTAADMRSLLIGYSGVIVWWRRSRLCRDGVVTGVGISSPCRTLASWLGCWGIGIINVFELAFRKSAGGIGSREAQTTSLDVALVVPLIEDSRMAFLRQVVTI